MRQRSPEYQAIKSRDEYEKQEEEEEPPSLDGSLCKGWPAWVFSAGFMVILCLEPSEEVSECLLEPEEDDDWKKGEF